MPDTNDIVIIGAARTPIGKFQGMFRATSAADLGAHAVREAVARAAIDPSQVHLQETFSDVVKTDKTGLSKTAHTRWMISAFANFLPGSTIFRLA